MDEKLFEPTPYGQLALLKFAKQGPVHEDFRIYECGWMNNGNEVMEVKGSVFRRAKSGPRAGQLAFKVLGTERVTYVTAEEIETFKGVQDAVKAEV